MSTLRQRMRRRALIRFAAGVMNIIDLPSLFFGQRRGEIKYIVLHTTQGTDSRTWLTQTGGVSAHYLIQGKNVYRLVGEDWTAWHAGRIVGVPTTPLWGGGNPNEESIGIEMEGFAAQPLDPDTLSATAGLIRDIRRRRGPLPLVNHGELSPGNRTDPGRQNRAAIDALLEEDMTPEEREAEFIALTRKHVSPTIEAMKHQYDPWRTHRHVPQNGITSEPFPPAPPVVGAVYDGASADLSVIIWRFPDGTRRFYKDGSEFAATS